MGLSHTARAGTMLNMTPKVQEAQPIQYDTQLRVQHHTEDLHNHNQVEVSGDSSALLKHLPLRQ